MDVEYWENVHPLYPFLDRVDFTRKSTSTSLFHVISSDPVFSALYHAVLALGCQYLEEGSFEPGKGKAWDLFQISLGNLADIIAPRGSITNLQVRNQANPCLILHTFVN